jgi:hypothetical protein
MTKVGVNELARHLCTNREGLKRLEDAGVIERLADGKSYNQDDCRRRVFEYLRLRQARGAGAGTKLLDARARLTELRIAVQEHKLADVAETIGALETVTAWYIVTLEGLPGRIKQARQDRELREELKTFVFETRNQLAERCRLQAESLETTGKAEGWSA